MLKKLDRFEITPTQVLSKRFSSLEYSDELAERCVMVRIRAGDEVIVTHIKPKKMQQPVGAELFVKALDTFDYIDIALYNGECVSAYRFASLEYEPTQVDSITTSVLNNYVVVARNEAELKSFGLWRTTSQLEFTVEDVKLYVEDNALKSTVPLYISKPKYAQFPFTQELAETLVDFVFKLLSTMPDTVMFTKILKPIGQVKFKLLPLPIGNFLDKIQSFMVLDKTVPSNLVPILDSSGPAYALHVINADQRLYCVDINSEQLDAIYIYSDVSRIKAEPTLKSVWSDEPFAYLLVGQDKVLVAPITQWLTEGDDVYVYQRVYQPYIWQVMLSKNGVLRSVS